MRQRLRCKSRFRRIAAQLLPPDQRRPNAERARRHGSSLPWSSQWGTFYGLHVTSGTKQRPKARARAAIMRMLYNVSYCQKYAACKIHAKACWRCSDNTLCDGSVACKNMPRSNSSTLHVDPSASSALIVTTAGSSLANSLSQPAQSGCPFFAVCPHPFPREQHASQLNAR